MFSTLVIAGIEIVGKATTALSTGGTISVIPVIDVIVGTQSLVVVLLVVQLVIV